MSSLYQLTGSYLDLIDLAEAATPEDAQAFTDTLEGLAGEIEQKVQNCAAWCRTVESRVAVIDSEIDRLKKRKEVLQGNVGRMKQHMQSAMEAAGRDRIVGDLFTIAIQLNPPTVVVGEDFKPTEWLSCARHVPERWEPDKKAILEVLKTPGAHIPGCSIERKTSLRIR